MTTYFGFPWKPLKRVLLSYCIDLHTYKISLSLGLKSLKMQVFPLQNRQFMYDSVMFLYEYSGPYKFLISPEDSFTFNIYSDLMVFEPLENDNDSTETSTNHL